MSDHSVDTAQVRRLAAQVQPFADALRAAATGLEQLSGAASATGSGTCAGIYTAYCNQWAEELRQDALAYERIVAAMVASAALYEATELANTISELL